MTTELLPESTGVAPEPEVPVADRDQVYLRGKVTKERAFSARNGAPRCAAVIERFNCGRHVYTHTRCASGASWRADTNAGRIYLCGTHANSIRDRGWVVAVKPAKGG